MGIHNIIHDVYPSLQSDNLWKKKQKTVNSMGYGDCYEKLNHNDKPNYF